MADNNGERKKEPPKESTQEGSKSPNRLKAKPSIQLFQSPAQRAQRGATVKPRGGGLLSPTRAGRSSAVPRGSLLLRGSGRTPGRNRGTGSLLSRVRSPKTIARVSQASEAGQQAASPLGKEAAGGEPAERSGSAAPPGLTSPPGEAASNPFSRPSPAEAASQSIDAVRQAALQAQNQVEEQGARHGSAGASDTAAGQSMLAASKPPGAIAPGNTGTQAEMPAPSRFQPLKITARSRSALATAPFGQGSQPFAFSSPSQPPQPFTPPISGAVTTTPVSAPGGNPFSLSAPQGQALIGSSTPAQPSISGSRTGQIANMEEPRNGSFGTNAPATSPPAAASSPFSSGLFGGASTPLPSTASSLPGGAFGSAFGSGFGGGAGLAATASPQPNSSGFRFGQVSQDSASGAASTSRSVFGGAFDTTQAATTAQPFSGGFGAFGSLAGGLSSKPPSQSSQSARNFGMRRDAAALQQRAARFGPNDATASDSQPEKQDLGIMAEDMGMESDVEGIGKGTMEGDCLEMCPPAEQAFRDRMRDIDSFERAVEGGPPTLAVKKFARTVEQLASNFRTLETLQRTQAHLLSILDRRDVPLAKIHHFLWDRFRGVRQDLFVQGYEDISAITMYEEHVRFMILAEHELSGYAGDNFNSHLNLEQINKACISLNGMYEHARSVSKPVPTEGEFRAYHLLLLMGTHGKYQYNSTEYRKALKDCEPVKDHPTLRRVLELRQLLAAGNFTSYFKRALESVYLLAGLASLYFPALRAHALRVLAKTNDVSKEDLPLSLDRFVGELQLDTPEQAELVCKALNLQVQQGPQGYDILLPRKGFMPTARTMPIMSSGKISGKGRPLRSQDVSGGTQPAPWDPTQAPAPVQHDQVSGQQDRQQQHALETQIQEQRREKWQALRTRAASLQAAQEAEEQTRLQAARREAQQQEQLQRQEEERSQRQREEAAEEEARRAALAEEARQAVLQRQQEEEEKRRALEEALRQREVQQRREREEQRKREAEERQRAEEEAERRRKAAATAEKRRLDQERREREEAERKMREAEEDARLRQEQIQQKQAAASFILARLGAQYTLRIWFASWTDHVAQVKEAQRLKEVKRMQSLAACRVGLLQRPLIAARKSQSPQLSQARQATPSPKLRLPQQPPLDISVALQPLVSNNGAASNVFYKLVLLHTKKAADHYSSLSAWLQRVLLGDRNHQDPVARLKLEVARPGQPPAILRTAVRDVSFSIGDKAATRTAMGGASAILLFIYEADDPSEVSPLLRQLLGTQTEDSGQSTSAGPLLLVLVGSEALVEPVKTWLAEELAAGVGKRLGARRVAALSSPDGCSSWKAALLQGLTWTAEHMPAQLPLKAMTLAELARLHLDAKLARVVAHWTAQPEHYITAFNTALQAACSQLRAAGSAAACLGGWPPADCYISSESPWLPEDWWKENINRLPELLLRLLLPSFSVNRNTPDEAVRDYLSSVAKIALCTSPGETLPWRQALCEAFQMQLSSLECVLPAVILEGQHLGSTTSSKPAEASVTVPASPLPLLLIEERPKRKWAGKSPPVLSPVDTGITPEPKVARTRASAGAPRTAGVGCRLGAKSPKAANSSGHSEADIFAELSINEKESSSDDETAQQLCQEAEEHTSWIKALLDSGSGATQPQPAIHSAQSLENEIRASSNYTAMLRELKGGF